MHRPWLLCALASCGGPSGSGADAGPGDAALPAARCDRPALHDVSSPTTVIGNGTPASCTAAALQQAAAGGGTIVFRCGGAPVTIAVGSQIVFTKDAVLDGGGLVTLSGGGSSRILLLDSGFDTPTPRLVVQRLTFRDGKSPATGADTAQGGAAIYRDGGSLTVLDSVFDGNHAPATSQDVAGSRTTARRPISAQAARRAVHRGRRRAGLTATVRRFRRAFSQRVRVLRGRDRRAACEAGHFAKLLGPCATSRGQPPHTG